MVDDQMTHIPEAPKAWGIFRVGVSKGEVGRSWQQ
jgi:hypothetical protein